jgi:hypothetical protein
LALPSESALEAKYATRISQLQDDLTDLTCLGASFRKCASDKIRHPHLTITRRSLTRIEKVTADFIAHYASFPEFCDAHFV